MAREREVERERVKLEERERKREKRGVAGAGHHSPGSSCSPAGALFFI